MHFAAVVTALTFALGVAAQGPPGGQHHGKHHGEHGGGSKACCLNKSEIQADGILSGVLTRGLLTDVLGSSDQACAKWHLIENLNLLGFTKQGQNGECAGSSATCHDDGCHLDH